LKHEFILKVGGSIHIQLRHREERSVFPQANYKSHDNGFVGWLVGWLRCACVYIMEMDHTTFKMNK